MLFVTMYPEEAASGRFCRCKRGFLRELMTEELLKERKEAMLALINDPTYVPMKIKELAMLLDVPREKRDELKEVLDALVADGKVGLSKRGKYGKPEAFTLVGTFCGHAKGFGFVPLRENARKVPSLR